MMAVYMKKCVLACIRLYQRTVSLDHGPLKVMRPYGQCKFHPTCSQYTYEAVKKYGIIKGLVLGIRRVARCHPWSDGGHDPVQ